jgi:hypothetical protein
MEITDSATAYDFDMAVNYFGTVIQNRLDDREEVKRNGHVVGYKNKYTLQQALGLNEPKRALITTTEQAIAAGFIPMGADGKPKKAAS